MENALWWCFLEERQTGFQSAKKQLKKDLGPTSKDWQTNTHVHILSIDYICAQHVFININMYKDIDIPTTTHTLHIKGLCID